MQYPLACLNVVDVEPYTVRIIIIIIHIDNTAAHVYTVLDLEYHYQVVFIVSSIRYRALISSLERHPAVGHCRDCAPALLSVVVCAHCSVTED